MNTQVSFSQRHGPLPLFPSIVLVAITTLLSINSIAAPATTLDGLLKKVVEGKNAAEEANQRRLDKFKQARDQQQTLLNDAKNQLNDTENVSQDLKQTIDENEAILSDLRTELNTKLGNFGELFGVTRQVAGETSSQLADSLISAQYPGRHETLKKIATSDRLATVEELRQLWVILLQQQTAQGKVARFTTRVNNEAGKPEEREVIRVGPFTAISQGKFLTFDRDTQQLTTLPRQPGTGHTASVRKLAEAAPGEVVETTVDPSRGTILGKLIQRPSRLEQFKQGGLPGYIVSVIAVIGLAIGCQRLVSLWLTSARVRRQMRQKSIATNNPLGRVLKVYEDNPGADTETLELKLNDAVLSETPRLDRGLNLLKVFAAVAPLIGLLGTVVGMIVTFQTITLWGTGDPKLMAGGISQALVTTVLGLVAAIPLLLLHNVTSGRARQILQVLEEQSAGLIAKRAEHRLKESRHV